MDEVQLRPVTFEALSALRHSIFVSESPGGISPEFLVIRYEGVYRHGGAGRGDALYIVAAAEAALKAWWAPCTILDLRDLQYEWGDNMEWITSIAWDRVMHRHSPLAIVVSDKCREALQSLRAARSGVPVPARKRRHHPMVAALPGRWRFYRSGLYISPLAPLLLGVMTGILTMLMGIGGGFVLIPAMLYILGMSANVVVGTSLFQILFVTMATTMMHALTTKAVDIVLAVLLLLGSVSGAQIGAKFAQSANPMRLRLILAVIVLLVAFRMALGLGWRPSEIYSVAPL